MMLFNYWSVWVPEISFSGANPSYECGTPFWLLNVPANSRVRKIILCIKKAEKEARECQATKLIATLHASDDEVFQRVFNILIGNGFSWNQESTVSIEFVKELT